MTSLVDIILSTAASPAAGGGLAAVAAWLPHAERIVLTPGDLARIDSYRGNAEALHDLLPAVLPLDRPVWYETEIVAQGGTRTIMGYGVTPVGDAEIDVWWVGYAPDIGRMVGPLGPLRSDATGIDPAADMDDPDTRELRAATGIIIRALAMRAGRRNEAAIHIHTDRARKSHWLAQSRAAGMTLGDWIIQRVERS